MLNKKMQAVLAMLGTVVPFAVQADQPKADAASSQQMAAGYNKSAAYMINDGWDVNLTANYIYWHLNRENLDEFENNDYASGFQVGMGFNMAGMDDWSFAGNYTWYRNSNDKNSVGESNDYEKYNYDDFVVSLSRPF